MIRLAVKNKVRESGVVFFPVIDGVLYEDKGADNSDAAILIGLQKKYHYNDPNFVESTCKILGIKNYKIFVKR